MWHMPGHTYSKLKRYQDAAWQQEASARVDHAHMMRDRVMPDQIHNFAHNNEWLTRNLNYLGRVNDAVALAKNMIELPRHRKTTPWPSPDSPIDYGKRGSASYGRTAKRLRPCCASKCGRRSSSFQGPFTSRKPPSPRNRPSA